MSDPIDVMGLDEIEVENTSIDAIDAENVNLIFVGIDSSGSMAPYERDTIGCLSEFKSAITDSKEADEILVARANFNDKITVGGYKPIGDFDNAYNAFGMTALYDVICEGEQKLSDYMAYLKTKGCALKLYSQYSAMERIHHRNVPSMTLRQALRGLTMLK